MFSTITPRARGGTVRLGMVCLIAALLLCCMGGEALGVKATNSEITSAKSWFCERFGKQAEAPPFSFVYDGRPSSEFICGWAREQSEEKIGSKQTRHTTRFSDSKTGLVITCKAIAYSDFPAVDWVLELTNNGKSDTPIIEDLQPFDNELKGSNSGFTLHHALGDDNNATSFKPLETAIGPGHRDVLSFVPLAGKSSEGPMPYFNLDCGDGGLLMAVGWSGQWKASFAQTGDGVMRVRAGQELTHFKLHPGESVRTPSIVLLFWDGKDDLRGNNLFRQLLLEHYLPRRDGKLVFPPICASVGWVGPDGNYEKPHLEAIPIYGKRGIEVFWSDMDPQQWYPKDFPQGTGTWEPDPVKYPNGLAPIGEAARKAGMEYLLWFEPERAQPGTHVHKTHPEWMMKAGEDNRLFNLGDPAARKWITDYVDVQVSAAKLGWMRWDFNISPLAYWRYTDAPDRQGISEMKYIAGLYAMWDDLRARHPGLVIDNCAGGGRRLDIETMKRGLPLWHSDMQCFGPNPAGDQLQNAGLFRWIPFHGCAAFGLEPSYNFRSAMTPGNILVPQPMRSLLEPETEAQTLRTVAAYKKARPYMLGDFYPLFPHVADDDVWFGYQFHRDDLDAGMAIIFRRKDSPDATKSIELKGIDPRAQYQITFADSTETAVVDGTKLANYAVKLDDKPGSAILYYEKVRR